MISNALKPKEFQICIINKLIMHSQSLHLNTKLENVYMMSPSSLPCTLYSFSSQCPSNHSLENVDESHSSNRTFSTCALYLGRQPMVFAISPHWSTQEFFITSRPRQCPGDFNTTKVEPSVKASQILKDQKWASSKLKAQIYILEHIVVHMWLCT
jgi:hypothetical protein